MNNSKTFIDDLPINSFHQMLTLRAAGGWVMDGYILSIIGVALIQISTALHLDNFWQGLIAAGALIGIFFGGFLGGWLTDKFGRKRIFLVSPIIFLLCSVAQLWVESAMVLFILRILIGVAVGIEYPVASAMMVEFLPKKSRGPRIAMVQILWFAGAFIAYFVGNLILNHVGGADAWRYVVASSAVLAAGMLIVRLGTPESPYWLVSKGRKAEADQIIQHIYGQGYSTANLSVSETKKSSSLIEVLRAGYGKRMFFVVVFWACAVIPVFAVYAFVPKILQAFNLSAKMAEWGSNMITMLFVVGCIFATVLISRMGRRKMLIQSFALSALALFGLAFVSHENTYLLLGLFGAFAIFTGPSQALQTLYPNELFPTEVRAAAMGMGTSLSRIGAAIGTWAVPMSLDKFGISATMFVAGIIAVIGLVVSVLLAPETGGKTLDETSSL